MCSMNVKWWFYTILKEQKINIAAVFNKSFVQQLYKEYQMGCGTTILFADNVLTLGKARNQYEYFIYFFWH